MKIKITPYKVTRFAIQIVFFIFMPALFSVAFNGIKYLADQIHKTEMISWNPFLATFIVLLAFTVIFGRFFCGFACAFGSLGDWLYTLSSLVQKKTRKKVFKLPDKVISKLLYLKFIVLIAIVGACLLGVYSQISYADPWELFASFRSGNFSLSGKAISGVIFLLIILGMLLIERFFCMFLCPMGAVFTLLPVLPFTAYNRKKNECIPGCTICKKTCPASISLGENDSNHGDCFQCGKCSMSCPKDNIRPAIRKFKGTEVWISLIKGAILFAVCYPLVFM